MLYIPREKPRDEGKTHKKTLIDKTMLKVMKENLRIIKGNIMEQEAIMQ